jgi:histidinol-phosphate aminotransferase
MDDLVADTEGLIIVRSFSKAWGLAGLRTGVLMGGPNLDELFARLHPLTGVPAPSEAGCLAALSEARDQMLVRVASVKRERERIGALLKGSTVDVASGGSANLIWARIPGLTADQLTARMRTSGVIVRNGAVIGSPDNICAAIRGDQAATDRLADGLIAAAAAVS